MSRVACYRQNIQECLYPSPTIRYQLPWEQKTAWGVLFGAMLLIAISGNCIVLWIVLGECRHHHHPRHCPTGNCITSCISVYYLVSIHYIDCIGMTTDRPTDRAHAAASVTHNGSDKQASKPWLASSQAAGGQTERVLLRVSGPLARSLGDPINFMELQSQ